MGSGIRPIVRGTVSPALFEKQEYAVLVGRFALPSLLAAAAALIAGTTGTLVALFCVAAVNLALVAPLVSVALEQLRRG